MSGIILLFLCMSVDTQECNEGCYDNLMFSCVFVCVCVCVCMHISAGRVKLLLKQNCWQVLVSYSLSSSSSWTCFTLSTFFSSLSLSHTHIQTHTRAHIFSHFLSLTFSLSVSSSHSVSLGYLRLSHTRTCNHVM